MKTKQVLSEAHVLIGRTRFVKQKIWYKVIIFLNKDLEIKMFCPAIKSLESYLPSAIKIKTQDWTIKTERIAGTISRGPVLFNDLDNEFLFSSEIKGNFNENDYKKTWIKLTFTPEICTFLKHTNIVPDELGMTFYPPKNNNSLFRLFNDNRIGARKLPNTFTENDESLYLKNDQRWTLSAMQKRIELITLLFSLFAGSPLTYRLLVGRKDTEVSFVQYHSITNDYSYKCPSQFNGHAYINKEKIPDFITSLPKKIEDLFSSSNKKKSIVLLSYFRQLYMAYYKEMKIALSFQLIEALANYKGLKLNNSQRNDIKKNLSKQYSKKMCPSCYNIISDQFKPETDDFDEYIGKALDVINIDRKFAVSPDLIKDILKKYRNEMLHGGLFENKKVIDEIDKTVKKLPDGYQKDLPVLMQAIVSIIGVNFILDIPFDKLTAIKRSMH